jgi:two-component system nitrate/nitrite sensor histidine kinase NarX
MGIVDRLSRDIRVFLSSRWLPWLITGLTLLVALLYEALLPIVTGDFSRFGQSAFWIITIASLALIYLIAKRVSKLIFEQEELKGLLSQAELRVEDAYQRLEAIFRISQTFVEASDEGEVIEPVLQLLVSLTGANGASFVPLDEHGQPQTALSHGELPFPILEAWNDYLASPGVRERCGNCEYRDQPEERQDCPLLKGPFAESSGLICLPVRRGEREYGVLNLFLSDAQSLDDRTRTYLRALLDEMSLGLEGVYLRRRELSALRQIQVLRQRADLSALLNGLLENVYRSLEADFAIMLVPRAGLHQAKVDLVMGDLPDKSRPFIDGILQGVMASVEPVLLGDVSGDMESGSPSRAAFRSLIAAPLVSPERLTLGVVLVGNRRVRGFNQRQLALLQTIAGQVALVVQNAALMAELEFQSMIQERARLAREIHDGLAQTIGFLKLQASQLRGMLGRGDLDKARQSADLFYSTLSEAYQDARQAIDGLRISPDDCGLNGWLSQTTGEFSDLSGLTVDLNLVEVTNAVSPEVQAQLIRIVQEALSNVRKHAQANQVWVACIETGDDLVLEVRDDGLGFLPEDVSSVSRHGLRGMRERAELIGADFQVVSRPKEGTIVRLRVPITNLEETVQ